MLGAKSWGRQPCAELAATFFTGPNTLAQDESARTMRTRNMRRQDTNGKNDAVARALGGARWVALGALLSKVASVACTQIVLRLAPSRFWVLRPRASS